jgi:hypothetical protein
MQRREKRADITVFYSYTDRDHDLCNKLDAHLSQLKRDELIKEWYAQQIPAGANRSQVIDQAIHTAQIVLLLISADFLASDSCYDGEMRQALERHRRGETRVIPIIIRPCDWQHSPFAQLQCLPRNEKPVTSWDNQDEAFVSIAQELRKSIAQQRFPGPLLSNA